ncbi:MAG: hypothetical protein ABFS18_12925 [Thermodesulfobacteriota bacterium]
MESSRYWQDFGELEERMSVGGLTRKGLALVHRSEKKQGCGAIIYRGRLMSMDVYLAVPTFMRRGITIAV